MFFVRLNIYPSSVNVGLFKEKVHISTTKMLRSFQYCRTLHWEAYTTTSKTSISSYTAKVCLWTPLKRVDFGVDIFVNFHVVNLGSGFLHSFNAAEPCSDSKCPPGFPLEKAHSSTSKMPIPWILQKHAFEHLLKRVDSGIDIFAHFHVVNTGSGFLHSFNTTEPCSERKMSSRVPFRKSAYLNL